MPIESERVEYSAGSTVMKSFISKPEKVDFSHPGVLVFPEWWGLTDYLELRAQKLAELGYVAMAVDMYGEGKIASNPADAGSLMNGVLSKMQEGEARVLAAMEFLKDQDEVDANRLGAIGYCFGGAIVLHAARKGWPLRAVASFHGALGPNHQAESGDVQTKILVCHGEADAMVTSDNVLEFSREMDRLGAEYVIKTYPDALHGFTNPATTALGQKYGIPVGYNEAADLQSWEELKDFLGEHL
ncbi:MAG TPA: dienelactone hydrolase [Deltaproteobacteria bacterium]|nr:dienelactone hydrolase [Deltaproteobacteria bacterium]